MFAKDEIHALFPVDRLEMLVPRIVAAEHLPISTRTEVLRDIEAAMPDAGGLCREGLKKLHSDARALGQNGGLAKPVTIGDPSPKEVSRFDGEGGAMQP